MPSPEIIRNNVDDGIYHVYSRGVNKQTIFVDNEDKYAFISFIDRYLSTKQHKNPSGGYYPNFHRELKILSYTIMDNHFHLLVKQVESGSLSKFMQCLLLAYRAHTRSKHTFIGPLFQSRYKAKLVNDEAYWIYISKYIHRNPKDYSGYEFSSYKYFRVATTTPPSWLQVNHVIASFSSREHYLEYVRSE